MLQHVVDDGGKLEKSQFIGLQVCYEKEQKFLDEEKRKGCVKIHTFLLRDIKLGYQPSTVLVKRQQLRQVFILQLKILVVLFVLISLDSIVEHLLLLLSPY